MTRRAAGALYRDSQREPRFDRGNKGERLAEVQKGSSPRFFLGKDTRHARRSAKLSAASMVPLRAEAPIDSDSGVP